MKLLIVDVQNTYRSYCHNLINKIPKFAEEYSEVIYLFDDVDGQDFHAEAPEEWMDNHQEFYDRLKVISKNYGFFRNILDLGLDAEDEEIIRLSKFMLQNNISDAREIAEIPEVLVKFKEQFKNSPVNEISFEDYLLYLPMDLIETLNNTFKSGGVVIGGGRNECLKEVCVLLKVLDIPFTVNEELTY